MKQSSTRLFPGDIVEVKSSREILKTLDENGTQDHLPFMPEMIEFCGKRFQVAKRAVKTCYYTTLGSSGMRKFRADDVVLLENVRCSGADHGGCEKACLIFWRESWLNKVTDRSAQSLIDLQGAEQLRAQLKTTVGPNKYFCQSSEILKSTEPLSRFERFGKCASEVSAGNCGWPEMAYRVAVWLFWRVRRVFLGPYARGTEKLTPVESLNLQSGEDVEVKSVAEISKTLDETAHNRGLYFTPGMRVACEKKHRVDKRIDKIIVDGTGEMRKLRNTVYLEDSFCGCNQVAFGGCPRGEFSYWREIWVKRTGNTSPTTPAS